MADRTDGAFEVAFEFEKETKNTYKYGETPEAGEPPRIGSLYVQKWALPLAPARVVVTVTAAH